MPRHGVTFIRPKGSIDIIGKTASNVEQLCLTRGTMVGDGSLKHMAGTVKLVTHRQFRPLLVGFNNLEIGVEVAVLLLGGSE